MSHDSSSESPEAAGTAAPSKSEKYDVYDANIRNFAPVARIMKLALPENAKIAKEAKECMQECVSEFISFITSEGECANRPSGPCDKKMQQQRSKGETENHGRNSARKLMKLTSLPLRSLREVSSGKAEDRQWRGHPFCHDVPGFRELRRGP